MSNAQWNHRLVSRTHDGETLFGIYEVHYDGEMNPVAITKDVSPLGIALLSDNIDELKTSLIRTLHNTTLPVLKYEDFSSFKRSVYSTNGRDVDSLRSVI